METEWEKQLPGQQMPELQLRASLSLPALLSPGQVGAQIGQMFSLHVSFLFRALQ